MTKTKADFANPQAEDWWLVEQLNAELEPRRLALGAARGWNDPSWYLEPAKLEELYDWLAANDTQLLNNLDYAEDDTAKAKWLDDFVEAVSAKVEPAHEAEPAAPAEAPEAVEAVASVAPPEPAKKSLFAKKHADNKAEEEETEAKESEEAREPEHARDGDQPPVAPPTPEETAAAAAAAEVLDHADLQSETKKVLEEYITNSAVPVDAGEVEELLKEFPDDFEKVFEEAKEGLDEEIDSFLSELDELEGEEGDEGDEELEDEGEEVEA